MTGRAAGRHGSRRSLLRALGVGAIAVGLLAVTVGLFAGARGNSAADDASNAASTTAAPSAGDRDVARGVVAPADGPFAPGRTPLPGFGEVAVLVRHGNGGSEVFCLLAALAESQRARGLMTVTDANLGGYDGMLFVFPDDTSGAFWMRNTPLPLSIAYLSAQGRMISKTDMAPCDDRASCPSYPADAAYRLAVEVPRGNLARLGIDEAARIEPGGACPAKS